MTEPVTNPEKQTIRDQVWHSMEVAKIARFPGARGRIPNFIGAEKAAARAAGLPEWQAARVVKCNPDSPQQPLRKLALQQGKTLYMAVPRLTDERCFVELDPARLEGRFHQASTIKGAFQVGHQVGLDDLRPIDLIVCGSVAVNLNGARVGKGGGYSDLEFALATQRGKVTARTVILTTVHSCQVVDQDIPMTEHDIPLDVIVTPEEVVRCERRFPRPAGVYWDMLPEEKIKAIPVLGRLRRPLPPP